MITRSKITWVLKCSKFCNLRCTYCYEYEKLSDPQKISLGDYNRLFEKIAVLSELWDCDATICWHGGEPLLLGLEYLKHAIDECNKAFSNRSISVTHSLQTNLVKISKKEIDEVRFLFSSIGVSFDPFSDKRINSGGRDSQKTVLKNMDALRNADVDFGCITVLHKYNIDNLEKVFLFFNEAGLSFRILPYFRSANETQSLTHGLEEKEITDAMKYLFDLWISYGKRIRIQPLDNYLRLALAFMQGGRINKYNKRIQERVIVVDTDGSLYAVADTYNSHFSYGNIFIDTTEEIVNSLGRGRALAEAEQRIDKMCGQCRFSGSCSGWYAAEATLVERSRQYKSSSVCPTVPEVASYIISRLEQIPSIKNTLGKVKDNECHMVG